MEMILEIRNVDFFFERELKVFEFENKKNPGSGKLKIDIKRHSFIESA